MEKHKHKLAVARIAAGDKEENRAWTGERRAVLIKQALTRREIRAEYGWSERSTARLEKRGLLVASKLFGKKFYLRTDVEACIHESK